MKRPLYFFCLVWGLIASINAFAQSSLYAQHLLTSKDQLFNRPLSPAPYIGMDLARSFFPTIIIQLSDGQAAPVWKNELKYTTNRTLFNPDIFEELGQYEWTDSLGWIPRKVCRFSINYNQTRKSVMTALEERAKVKEITRVSVSYTFNEKNLVNEEKMALDGQVFTTKFEYNAAGKLITASQSKDGGDTWINAYTYDDHNRITEELFILRRMVSFGSDSMAWQQHKSSMIVFDSLTKEQYRYDAANRVIKKESYVFDDELSEWKRSIINEYTYNQQGQLKEDVIYTLINNAMAVSGSNSYAYTATGRPDTIQSFYLDSSLQLQGYKVKVFYDALDSAAMAFQYVYTSGGVFESTNSHRWLFFDKTTGLDDRYGENTLFIYPNPCKDVLSLPVDKGLLSIWDMSGREVHRAPLMTNLADLSFLQPGFYYVSIDDSKPVKLFKE